MAYDTTRARFGKWIARNRGSVISPRERLFTRLATEAATAKLFTDDERQVLIRVAHTGEHVEPELWRKVRGLAGRRTFTSGARVSAAA